MDRRLAFLSLGAASAVLAASRFPGFAGLIGLLVPLAGLAGTLLGGLRGWCLTILPAAVILVVVGSENPAAFVAGVAVGPIAVTALRRGWSPGAALAAGAVPYAVWAAGLGLTGFDPFPPEAEEAIGGLLAEAAEKGEIPADRLAEVERTSGIAFEVLRRTWVASEATWYWVTLVVAWILGRRLWRDHTFAPLGRFSRFDVPDALVGALIVGLGMTLIPVGEASDSLHTVGWNLVSGAGFFWAVRGAAIEWYWMERGRWRVPWRVAFLAGGAMLFLPAFLAVTVSLGLFDTWFDFRRVRTSEEGGSPFSFHHPSSGDDFPGKE